MKTVHLLCACAIGGLAGTVQASVLVSNLAEPLRSFNMIRDVEWAAQGFETDANPYSLTSIDALIQEIAPAAGAFAELRAADAMGNMDTSAAGLLATFTIPALTSGMVDINTFVPVGAVALAPSTRYFFAMGVVGEGRFDWTYAEGNGQVGPGAFHTYEYSFDGGATWTNFGGDNPFHMRVNVELVPGPAASGLIGLVGLLAARRRRA